MISRTQDGYQFEEHSLKAVSGKGLSPRELISLLYKAAGFKAEDISTEMDCAVTTTNKRQQNINYKLKARNSAHAVTTAFREGIIIHYLLIVTSSTGAVTTDHSELARHQAPRTSSRTQHRTQREPSLSDTDLLFLSSPNNEVNV